MSKVIFWLVVVFGVLFIVRLVNAAKAKSRREASGQGTRGNKAATGTMVRCMNCGVFLPRTDALPMREGFTCGDAGCSKRH